MDEELGGPVDLARFVSHHCRDPSAGSVLVLAEIAATATLARDIVDAFECPRLEVALAER